MNKSKLAVASVVTIIALALTLSGCGLTFEEELEQRSQCTDNGGRWYSGLSGYGVKYGWCDLTTGGSEAK